MYSVCHIKGHFLFTFSVKPSKSRIKPKECIEKLLFSFCKKGKIYKIWLSLFFTRKLSYGLTFSAFSFIDFYLTNSKIIFLSFFIFPNNNLLLWTFDISTSDYIWIYSLKYKFKIFGSKDMVIWKSEFGAKTQFF